MHISGLFVRVGGVVSTEVSSCIHVELPLVKMF